MCEFLSNKYTTWYFQIVEKARLRNGSNDNQYMEKHHIVPKSLNGDDSPDNLVSLTYREHFVCHRLLTKMTDGKSRQKMCFALSKMRRRKSINVSISSRQLEVMREAAAAAMRGREVKQETKDKLRKVRYKQLADESYQEKWQRSMSLRNQGMRTDEYRKASSKRSKENYSKSGLSKWNGSQEQKEFLSSTLKGKSKSPEHVAAMSKARKRNPHPKGNPMENPESRLRLSESKKGTKALIKDGQRKMARPGDNKWLLLLEDGWVPSS